MAEQQTKTDQQASQGRAPRAGDPVEELARQVFLRRINGVIKSYTASAIAAEAFADAEAFQRVADERRARASNRRSEASER